MYRKTFLIGVFTLLLPQLAFAYKPDSKVVRDLVARGVAYLQSDMKMKYHLGEECLVAYALHKAGATNSPKIREALENLVKSTSNGKVNNIGRHFTYDSSVAIILMAEVDPTEYRPTLQIYTKTLLDRQLTGGVSDGAWTYGETGDGDTSQTQYAMLALWSANAAGIEVPASNVDRAMNWLIRTQHASGGFTYTPAQPQYKPSHSMAAGAVGSLLMGADILNTQLYKKRDKKEDQTPGIRKKQESKEAQQLASRSSLNPDTVRQSIGRGNGWLKNNFTISPPRHAYYFLYGLERYFSFREKAEGVKEPEPAWYNAGVAFLQKTIKKGDGNAGYWNIPASQGAESAPADTAFAMLFLLRASEKAIQVALGDGVLIGGHDLPDDLTTLTQDADGSIKKPQMESDLSEVLKGLDSTASFDSLPKVPKLSDKGGEREKQIAQLRQLISGENYEARRFAVRALGRARSLDNVPPLIYALTDPDKRIVKEARDGLRFISRKFKGQNMPDNPTPAQVAKGISDWKSWYLSVRPDADVDYLPQ